MAKARPEARSETTELLEKLLTVKLYSMGVTQSRIAKIVKKSKTWVNALLKGVPPRTQSR